MSIAESAVFNKINEDGYTKYTTRSVSLHLSLPVRAPHYMRIKEKNETIN